MRTEAMTSSGVENSSFAAMTSSLQQPVEEESLNCVIQFACSQFKQRFNEEALLYAFAPGRVNLIGDHVDYNDGVVLPIAVPLYTVIAGTNSGSETFEIETLCETVAGEKRIQFHAKGLKPGNPSWANYVKGVIANFPGPVVPFKAVIASSVPIGCGLSSSASLEVAVFSFLEGLCNTDLKISLQEKAIICQRAEHLYANVPCGLMDQMISLMGRKNNALLIDCKTLETHLLEIRDSTVSFLVCNSNVRHSLADSEYSSRRKICEQVAALLGKSSLRDVSMRELESSRSVLTEQMYCVARHVVTEICRTESAAEALKAQDYTIFGTLMTQSHISLRDDYKVSCVEVDELVEITLECDGVYGSRMTGAGFGGCTVTLLKTDCVQAVIDHIKIKYSGTPQFFVVKATKGSQFERL